MQTETYQQDVLASELELNLVQASGGQRFANYIVDLIIFYVLFFLIGILIAMVNPQTIDSISYEDSNIGANLLDRLIGLVLFGVYMGIMEAIFKGKSIGKFITGTRAVYEADGQNISVGTAFARGFSRIVPFEPFSALGSPSYPWHDKWTGTMVINEKQSTRI